MFETILVSDHDLERRAFLYETLMQLNYRVTTVPSPEQLMEVLTQERPQAIILGTEPAGGALVRFLRALRDVDRMVRVVVLVSPTPLDGRDQAVDVDPRLTLLTMPMDRSTLLRSILSVLKVPEVERVNPQAAVPDTILLIEDEPRVAGLVSEYLHRRGYRVMSVANGEEAIQQMRVIHPRIVILDLLLPGMDGLLTLQHLKAIDPSVTVIIMSGFEDPTLMRQANALGSSAYLVKPLDLAKLEATLLSARGSAVG